MAMKGYFRFSKAPASYCLVSYLGHSLVEGVLTTLQRSSRWILQPQLTGQRVGSRFVDVWWASYNGGDMVVILRMMYLLSATPASCLRSNRRVRRSAPACWQCERSLDIQICGSVALTFLLSLAYFCHISLRNKIKTFLVSAILNAPYKFHNYCRRDVVIGTDIYWSLI